MGSAFTYVVGAGFTYPVALAWLQQRRVFEPEVAGAAWAFAWPFFFAAAMGMALSGRLRPAGRERQRELRRDLELEEARHATAVARERATEAEYLDRALRATRQEDS